MNTELEQQRLAEHYAKYDAVIRANGGLRAFCDKLPASLNIVRQALREGDQHLNSIKLSLWDAAASRIRLSGDNSLCARVCTLKQAARQLSEQA